MAVQGLRNTADFVTDQRPKDWLETILRLYPNGKAPLTALRAVMKKRNTVDPEYNWWTKNFPSRRIRIGVAITDVATTIPVIAASSESEGGSLQLREGHILLIEATGELVRLTADPVSDVAVVVTRGFAGTTNLAVDPTAAGTNPNMLVIGTAFPENSPAPTAVSYNPVKYHNFTQIWRHTLGMSRTAKNTRLRTGNQVAEAKRETLEQHTVRS